MIFSTGPCDIEMENLSALDRATVRGGEVYPAWAGPHPFTARQYSRTLGLGLMTCGCGLSLWMINGYLVDTQPIADSTVCRQIRSVGIRNF